MMSGAFGASASAGENSSSRTAAGVSYASTCTGTLGKSVTTTASGFAILKILARSPGRSAPTSSTRSFG